MGGVQFCCLSQYSVHNTSENVQKRFKKGDPTIDPGMHVEGAFAAQGMEMKFVVVDGVGVDGYGYGGGSLILRNGFNHGGMILVK